MRLASCLLGFAMLSSIAACSDDDADSAVFVAVSEGQPAALLSVWGSSASDVWVVGGDARAGAGPYAAHYDGTAWTKHDTGQRNVDLWWVFGFEGGPVYMSGSNGTILRYQGGNFEKLTTPGNFIVFGMWGAAPNDIWAVGGNFGTSGFVWRFDGTTWTPVANIPPDLTGQGTCWKVNGRASNDVWISATSGATLHWNGTSLERMDVPVDASLLSIAGNGERFVTVGGNFDGVLYENDGSGWKSALPTGGPRLTGVAVSADTAYAVGQTGTVLRRGSDGTWAVQKPRATNENLHAVWIDPDGGVWSVGGQYDTPPMRAGVLIHSGKTTPAALP